MRRCRIRGPVDVADRGRCRVAASGGAALSWHPDAGPAGGAGAACASARRAVADKLCQAKGFREGKSLDTDAAEKCSAKVYLPGYKRGPGDCRTENYVTRALCQ